METREIHSWLMDMDGVLVHETSALATAAFLESQRPNGTAFVVGESGLTTALYQSGYTLTDSDPDYVVLGETRTYSIDRITQAIRLIAAGSRFIATNPDPTGVTPEGPHPATGSVAALITKATGVEPTSSASRTR